MTRFHKQTLTCPRCLNEVEATIWDIIDTHQDPYLREEVLHKAVQLVECNICNEAWVQKEPFLYHDPEERLLFYYCPQFASLLDAAQADDGSLPDAIREALPDEWTHAPSDYRMRLVTSYNDLIEKLHIFGAGLDDRLMALVVIALRTRRLEEPGATPWEEVHFLSASERAHLFSTYNEAENWQAFELDPQAYQNAVQTLAPYLPPEGHWARIDEAWALRFIEAHTQIPPGPRA